MIRNLVAHGHMTVTPVSSTRLGWRQARATATLDTSQSCDEGGGADVWVDDVTTEIVVDDGSSRGRVTVFQLTWRSNDPFAVTMELVSRPEHPALPRGVWVAPRDSLRAGLDTPVGDGDVRITPEAMDGRRQAGVRLDLSNGDRQSVVVLEAAPLRSFLDRTESVVPVGEEHPEHELDEVLSELLRT